MTPAEALAVLNAGAARRFLDWHVDVGRTGELVTMVIAVAPRRRRADGTVGHRRGRPAYTDRHVVIDHAVVEAAWLALGLFPELGALADTTTQEPTS